MSTRCPKNCRYEPFIFSGSRIPPCPPRMAPAFPMPRDKGQVLLRMNDYLWMVWQVEPSGPWGRLLSYGDTEYPVG